MKHFNRATILWRMSAFLLIILHDQTFTNVLHSLGASAGV